jgi:hypothetical protein
MESPQKKATQPAPIMDLQFKKLWENSVVQATWLMIPCYGGPSRPTWQHEEPQWHHPKYKKADAKGHIVWLHWWKHPEQVNYRNRKGTDGCEGWEVEGMGFSSSRDEENILQLDGR